MLSLSKHEGFSVFPAIRSEHLEQAGDTHAAAHAHGHHGALRAAPAPLDQDVAGHPVAAHAIGMADRDRAAVDVVFLGVDAEPVAAADRKSTRLNSSH